MSIFSEAIPQTFESWKHCITVNCSIRLTTEFIDQRIFELKGPKNEHTIQFERLYGKAYLKNILAWFEQARISEV